VFRRLAVFVGGATLAMIQRVVADRVDHADHADHADQVDQVDPNSPKLAALLDTWGVLDALGGLVDKSMVGLVDADGVAAPRYHLLNSHLALAVERLQADEEAQSLRHQHARAVQALLEQSLAELIDDRSDPDTVRATLAADLDNADAALRWAWVHDTEQAQAIAPLLAQALGALSAPACCTRPARPPVGPARVHSPGRSSPLPGGCPAAINSD